jgi:hypothetical protein
LAPELEPVGFRIGFGCPSDFVNGFLLDFFGFLSGFEFFSGFLGFFQVSGFFGVHVFFRFRVHPYVKNKTRT